LKEYPLLKGVLGMTHGMLILLKCSTTTLKKKAPGRCLLVILVRTHEQSEGLLERYKKKHIKRILFPFSSNNEEEEHLELSL
jgi:hypothetical protein